MQKQDSSTSSSISKSDSSAKDKPKTKLKPLKVTCTGTDCGNGLHCFKRTRKMVMENKTGQCRSCGVSLVDWSRVHGRKLDDVAYTFESLKHEMIRHHFWHIEIDEKAVNHARRKGREGMHIAAENRVRKSVGAANLPFDGRQTPMSGNSLFYAQHATATCCRKCMFEWYGIEIGRDLTEEEIAYFTELIVRFINERLPQITEEGERIPRTAVRRATKKHPTPATQPASKRLGERSNASK